MQKVVASGSHLAYNVLHRAGQWCQPSNQKVNKMSVSAITFTALTVTQHAAGKEEVVGYLGRVMCGTAIQHTTAMHATRQEAIMHAKLYARTKMQFECSEDATAFMDQLSAMLDDPRLAQWCVDTEDNFSCNVSPVMLLAQLNDVMEELVNVMDDAC